MDNRSRARSVTSGSRARLRNAERDCASPSHRIVPFQAKSRRPEVREVHQAGSRRLILPQKIHLVHQACGSEHIGNEIPKKRLVAFLCDPDPSGFAQRSIVCNMSHPVRTGLEM